ncbi:hypothetical protein F5148DRAFT_1282977 [Russula earlei]|uniref:Uncharacterized protein n=1 Tax=Russula earlei TaxID=71964 RepID=A0ACC0UF62_9AGAM|nr:hypothetical protein F5148DRAFT_1282977 [Russula earlei]
MSHLTHRQNVARIVSSIRLTRPYTPFYRLAAHRIPTLWTLYRGLLRASPSPIIRSHIQTLFHDQRHLTSPALTKTQLEKGQRWLDSFKKARQGDEYLRSVLQRFERLVVAHRNLARMCGIVNDSLSWKHRLLSRPIFTAALFKPSIYNGPLPRLKPQPDHISGMIHKRRITRSRRIERQRALFSQIEDLQVETKFETNLAANGERFKPYFSQLYLPEWRAPVESCLEELQAAFERDAARATRSTPPSLLRQLKAARCEKIANKTRERERQMRGEVLSVTRYRSRLGFPAHVLALWSPKVRKANLVARCSAGKVGYVGQVKRALGYRISPEDDGVDNAKRKRLDSLAESVQKSNQSRRDREVMTERRAEGGVLRSKEAVALEGLDSV